MAHSLKHVIPAALAAMMLTACGGGGGDTILDQETDDGTSGNTGSETNGTEGNTVPSLLSSAYTLGAVSSADVYKIAKAMNIALGQHINVDQKYQDGASSNYDTTSGLQTHYAETKTCAASGSAEYSYSVSSQFLSSSDNSRVYSLDEGVTADYSDCSDDTTGAWFFSGSKTTVVDNGTFSFGNYRATGLNQDNAFVEIYHPLYLGNYAGDKTYYTKGNIVTNYKNLGRVVKSDTSSPEFIQYQPVNSTNYSNGVPYSEDESSEAVAITLNDFNFNIAYSNGEADLVGGGEIGSSELGYAFDLDVLSSLRVANKLLNSNYLDVLTSGTATATGSNGTEIRYEFTTSGFTYSITGLGSSSLITWATVYPTI